MRVYYQRSIRSRILAVLVAIPVIAYLAKLTYEWLVPFLPLVGGGILLVVFVSVAFRHRRY